MRQHNIWYVWACALFGDVCRTGYNSGHEVYGIPYTRILPSPAYLSKSIRYTVHFVTRIITSLAYLSRSIRILRDPNYNQSGIPLQKYTYTS